MSLDPWSEDEMHAPVSSRSQDLGSLQSCHCWSKCRDTTTAAVGKGVPKIGTSSFVQAGRNNLCLHRSSVQARSITASRNLFCWIRSPRPTHFRGPQVTATEWCQDLIERCFLSLPGWCAAGRRRDAGSCSTRGDGDSSAPAYELREENLPSCGYERQPPTADPGRHARLSPSGGLGWYGERCQVSG